MRRCSVCSRRAERTLRLPVSPAPVPYAGGEHPLLILLTIAFSIIVYFVYAALGSAMPRAGGDYVFETRTLNRVVGFAIPWGSNLIFWLVFAARGPTSPTLWDSSRSECVRERGRGVLAGDPSRRHHRRPCDTRHAVGARRLRLLHVQVRAALHHDPVRGHRDGDDDHHVPGEVERRLRPGLQLLQRRDRDHLPGCSAAAVENGYAPAAFNLRNTLVWFVVLAGIMPFTMFAAQGMLGEVKAASNLEPALQGVPVPRSLHGHRHPAHAVAADAACRRQRSSSTSTPRPTRAGAVAPPSRPTSTSSRRCSRPASWVVVLISLGFIGGGFGSSPAWPS